MPGTYVYILECSDGSFYVGSTRQESVEQRVGEHQDGKHDGYTFARRPVKLAWAEHFAWITDAIAFEQRIKRWSRAKKLALIRGDWEGLQFSAKRRGGRPRHEPGTTTCPWFEARRDCGEHLTMRMTLDCIGKGRKAA